MAFTKVELNSSPAWAPVTLNNSPAFTLVELPSSPSFVVLGSWDDQTVNNWEENTKIYEQIGMLGKGSH